MSSVQRALRAVKIAGALAALVASCALPAYQVEGPGGTGAASNGSGGRGGNGSDAVTTVSSSGPGGETGQGGGGGSGGAGDQSSSSGHGGGDQGGGGGGACTGAFAPCPGGVVEGTACDCVGEACFLGICSKMDKPLLFICAASSNNPGGQVWKPKPIPFQCCPGNEKPCRSDQGEICVVTTNPVEAACALTDCPAGTPGCDPCMGDLCAGQSSKCEVHDGIVFCTAP